MNTDVIWLTLTVLAMFAMWWLLWGFMAWVTSLSIGVISNRNLANGIGHYLRKGLMMWVVLLSSSQIIFSESDSANNASA